MKRSYTTLLLSIIMILSLCGCSFESKPSETEIYIEQLNKELAAFAQCANDFSDSLAQISDTSTVPSETELDAIDANISDLSEICARLQSMKAPNEYADAAEALTNSMQKYTSALEKCSGLLDFYREFDSKIHEYKNPVTGSEELQKQAKELYEEFALLMQQATISFHKAQDAFDTGKKQ